METGIIALLHAAATLAMCGVIWFVQVVHYPLFTLVGRGDFAGYERAHTRRTGRVFGPFMVVEGLTALALLVAAPAGPGMVAPAAGFVFLLLIWASTAWLQVPAHRRLEQGFDADWQRRLVRTNWIRTVLWTLRAPLALWMLHAG